jgi:hypothetical protein
MPDAPRSAHFFPAVRRPRVPIVYGTAAILAALAAAAFVRASVTKKNEASPPPATASRIAQGSSIQFRTDHDLGGTPPRFHAPDVIYAVVNFPAPLFGRHLLEGRWRGPDGRLMENTRWPVSIPATGAQQVQLWYRFAGTASDRFTDRAATNQGGGARNGAWRLEVRLDDRAVGAAGFDINGF